MSTQFFDSYGSPNQEIQDFAYNIERETEQFLRKMLEDGASMVEIRAAGEFISGSASLGVSHTILNNRSQVYKKRLEGDGAELSEEEKELCSKFNLSGLLQYKVDAIKSYCKRTGNLLKPSKDKIDVFCFDLGKGLGPLTVTENLI